MSQNSKLFLLFHKFTRDFWQKVKIRFKHPAAEEFAQVSLLSCVVKCTYKTWMTVSNDWLSIVVIVVKYTHGTDTAF